MKHLLSTIFFVIIPFILHANDRHVFWAYAQKADSAFTIGNYEVCFHNHEETIKMFNLNRGKYIKDKEICDVVFTAYSTLAILDNRKKPKEICELLANGLSLIEENSTWIIDYANKAYIINCFIILIKKYSELKQLELACKYNESMISFSEKYYKYGLPTVLLSACSLFSSINEFEKNYTLYQRLYTMFDELDPIQQYKVVKELLHFEYQKGNYSYVVELSLIHEELIAKSKDEHKQTVLDISGFGFLKNARKLNDMKSSWNFEDINNAYKLGCEWALRNNILMFPTICINYAYWLYQFDNQKNNAIKQFGSYLNCVEHTPEDNLFDGKYREIEDAEQAINSILIQKIIKTKNPADLQSILNNYPRIISAIKNAPTSYYFEDFSQIILISKEKCYGK